MITPYCESLTNVPKQNDCEILTSIPKQGDDEDKPTRRFDGSGQRRNMTIINESGLYSLILSWLKIQLRNLCSHYEG